MAKARLLESDVTTIARLLEDPDEWGNSPRDFSRKILETLYNNDSVASINATRGIIVVRGASDCLWAIGPYPTVSAAKAAVAEPTFTGFSGVEKLYAMHMTHPHRYYEERKVSARQATGKAVSRIAQPKAA